MKMLLSLLTWLLLAGCSSTKQMSSAYTNAFPPGPAMASPAAKLEPYVVQQDDCKSGRFYACEIEPFGPLGFVAHNSSSALACGRCVDGRAQGHVLAIWCKRPGCKDVDISRKSDIWGLAIVDSNTGSVRGTSVVLVSEIGAYYGSLTPERNFGHGILKRDRRGNALIGEFNPDGTLKNGVQINLRSDGKFQLIAGTFLKNSPIGFAHFYEDDAYVTMQCSETGCVKHNPNELNESLRAILQILIVEWVENLLFTRPLRLAILATLPKNGLVRTLDKAYDAWGHVQTLEKIGEVLHR
jgi:hypothetical protein